MRVETTTKIYLTKEEAEILDKAQIIADFIYHNDGRMDTSNAAYEVVEGINVIFEDSQIEDEAELLEEGYHIVNDEPMKPLEEFKQEVAGADVAVQVWQDDNDIDWDNPCADCDGINCENCDRPT